MWGGGYRGFFVIQINHATSSAGRNKKQKRYRSRECYLRCLTQESFRLSVSSNFCVLISSYDFFFLMVFSVLYICFNPEKQKRLQLCFQRIVLSRIRFVCKRNVGAHWRDAVRPVHYLCSDFCLSPKPQTAA